MNRGKRRGVSSGFANLRDGVKRRLFDPHSKPVTPDPQKLLSQLAPLTFTEPTIPTALAQSDPETPIETKPMNDFTLQLFEAKASIDYAFLVTFKKQNDKKNRSHFLSRHLDVPKSSSALHLLMKTSEVDFWDSGVLSLFSTPSDWFPKELNRGLKRKATTPGGPKRVRFGGPSMILTGDVTSELLPDATLLEVAEKNRDDEAVEDDATVPEADNAVDGEAAGEDADDDIDEDSEDERWNGGGQPGGDEEEDEGDDYCETYFDNGEGDIDEFNVQMNDPAEDLDGSGYYE